MKYFYFILLLVMSCSSNREVIQNYETSTKEKLDLENAFYSLTSLPDTIRDTIIIDVMYIDENNFVRYKENVTAVYERTPWGLGIFKQYLNLAYKRIITTWYKD